MKNFEIFIGKFSEKGKGDVVLEIAVNLFFRQGYPKSLFIHFRVLMKTTRW